MKKGNCFLILVICIFVLVGFQGTEGKDKDEENKVVVSTEGTLYLDSETEE